MNANRQPSAHTFVATGDEPLPDPAETRVYRAEFLLHALEFPH